MENARDIQEWRTVNTKIYNLVERSPVNVIYNEARLDEYRNAILCIFYRQPLPFIYIAHNVGIHEYKLINDNSVMEAYLHYKSDKFDMEDKMINGRYSNLELQIKRGVDEIEVTAKVFQYTDTTILNQVTEMVKKLKS